MIAVLAILIIIAIIIGMISDGMGFFIELLTSPKKILGIIASIAIIYVVVLWISTH